MQVVDNLHLGGAQTLVAALAGAARAHPELDLDIEVVSLATPQVSPATQALAELSVPVHHLPPRRARELADARALDLRRLLGRGHFDLVHAHLDYAMAITATATLRCDVGYVLTLHNTVSELYEFGGLRRALARWSAHRADLVVACGARVRTDSPLVAARDDVEVLPNPAPEPAQPSAAGRASARRALATDPDALSVVSISRLAPSKNVDRIIDAVLALRVGGVPVELAVIGDGPERANLEERATSEGVRFLGQRSDVAELMAGADVLVCPFERNEGMPMSVLEAMASGIVVVGSASGDMDAALAGGRGVVLEPATVRAIESTLARLAADPDLRRTVGAAARRWAASERSQRAWAERTVALYRSVLDKG